MQEGIRHLLKLKSTGNCPRTNDGSHLIEIPDGELIEKGRLPWCVQCGIEFSRTEAELLKMVFEARATLEAHRRFHEKAGCPGSECYVCQLEERAQ